MMACRPAIPQTMQHSPEPRFQIALHSHLILQHVSRRAKSSLSVWAALQAPLVSHQPLRQRHLPRRYGTCSLVVHLRLAHLGLLSLTGKPVVQYSLLYLIALFMLCRVDLDIEGGGSQFYDSFVNEIRSLSSGASKQ